MSSKKKPVAKSDRPGTKKAETRAARLQPGLPIGETRRELAEEALRASEERYRGIIENSPVGIFQSTPAGRYLKVNSTMAKIFGYDSSEDMLAGIRDIATQIHVDPARRREFIRLLEENGQISEFSNQNYRKDGTIIWTSTDARVVKDQKGDVQYYEGFMTDITARKQAELALRESEIRFRALIEQAPVAIVITRNGIGLYANQKFREMFGSENEEEMVGRPIIEYYAPQFREESKERTRKRSLGLPVPFEFESLGLRKDGSHIPVHVAVAQVKLSDGEANIAFINDITERKRAEEDLLESHQLLEKTLSSLLDAVFIINADPLEIRDCNLAASTIFGYSRQEMLNQKTDFLHVDQVSLVEFRHRLNTDVKEKGFLFLPEFRMKRKDGTVFPSEHSVIPLEDEQGKLIGWVSVVRDISERKQAEAARRDAELQLHAVLTNAPITIFATDSKGIFTLSEGKGLEHVGLKPGENVGLSARDLYNSLPFVEETGEVVLGKDVINRAFAGETVTSVSELRGVSFENQIGPLRDSEGVIVGIVGVATDITLRKRAEDALRENEQRLSSIYNTVGDVVFYLAVEPGGQYRFTSVNPAFGKVTGIPIDQVIGRTVNEIIPEPSLTLVLGKYQQAIEEKAIVRWEEISDYPTGRLVGEVSVAPVFDEAGTCTHLVGSVHDITESKRAEEEVRQLNAQLELRVEERTRELREAQEKLVRQEKLAVLGQLAGGVGHELRNPLGVINTAIYYLKLVQPDASDKVKKYHAIIEQEVHTADKIISDLLDFSRIKSVDRESVSLPELMKNTLTRFPVPGSCKVTLKLPADLPTVLADPHQMEQVLGNLIINACQAMASPAGMISQGSTGRGKKVGRVTISARAQRKMVFIAVKDTGSGIAPENMSKLFEPLFTTKSKGIGLGLAVSKKLAEANDGRIEVESELGKGSTFTLVLPVYKIK